MRTPQHTSNRNKKKTSHSPSRRKVPHRSTASPSQKNKTPLLEDEESLSVLSAVSEDGRSENHQHRRHHHQSRSPARSPSRRKQRHLVSSPARRKQHARGQGSRPHSRRDREEDEDEMPYHRTTEHSNSSSTGTVGSAIDLTEETLQSYTGRSLSRSTSQLMFTPEKGKGRKGRYLKHMNSSPSSSDDDSLNSEQESIAVMEDLGERDDEDVSLPSCCLKITAALQRRGNKATLTFVCLTVSSSFILLYGFRRPAFAATEFKGVEPLFGLPPKLWFSIVHLFGFSVGKLFAATILVALSMNQYAHVLLSIPIFGLLAWVALAVADGNPTGSIIALFFTGFPLAWSFPACYRFIEGRHHSGVIAAILTSGFSAGSAIGKSAGAFVLSLNVVSELWMPAVTALGFLVPTLVAVSLLGSSPEPNEEEKRVNSSRKPMTPKEQKAFVSNYWPGMALMILTELSVYIFITFRELFHAEIVLEMAEAEGTTAASASASSFLATELPITVLTLALMIGLGLIKDNRIGVMAIHGVFIVSGLCIVALQGAYSRELISGSIWFTGTGFLGTATYSIVSAMLADRLFGAIGVNGTVTFIINIANMIATLGAIGALLMKGYMKDSGSYSEFLGTLAFLVGIAVVVFSSLGMLCWWKHIQVDKSKLTRVTEDGSERGGPLKVV